MMADAVANRRQSDWLTAVFTSAQSTPRPNHQKIRPANSRRAASSMYLRKVKTLSPLAKAADTKSKAKLDSRRTATTRYWVASQGYNRKQRRRKRVPANPFGEVCDAGR